jgi:hypothetical protein
MREAFPEDLAALVAELRDRHGCHTVILYGSRARGDHRPDSDYDVLGIRDAPAASHDGPAANRAAPGAYRDARDWRDTWLDAWIYCDADLEPRALLHIDGGRILLERDDRGRTLLEAVAAALRHVPPPLTPEERTLRVSWSRKMLARARRGWPDDLEGNYRRTWLLFDLLESYFCLRGLWYQGPKKAFAWLETHDPAAWRRFDAALRPGAGLEPLEALVELVVG